MHRVMILMSFQYTGPYQDPAGQPGSAVNGWYEHPAAGTVVGIEVTGSKFKLESYRLPSNKSWRWEGNGCDELGNGLRNAWFTPNNS